MINKLLEVVALFIVSYLSTLGLMLLCLVVMLPDTTILESITLLSEDYNIIKLSIPAALIAWLFI